MLAASSLLAGESDSEDEVTMQFQEEESEQMDYEDVQEEDCETSISTLTIIGTYDSSTVSNKVTVWSTYGEHYYMETKPSGETGYQIMFMTDSLSDSDSESNDYVYCVAAGVSFSSGSTTYRTSGSYFYDEDDGEVYLLAAKLKYLLDTSDYGLNDEQEFWIIQKFLWVNDIFGLNIEEYSGCDDPDDWTLNDGGEADSMYEQIISDAQNVSGVSGGIYLYIADNGDQSMGRIVYEVVEEGVLKLVKSSEDEEYAEEYSLRGALYGVYSSESDAENEANAAGYFITGKYGTGYAAQTEERSTSITAVYNGVTYYSSGAKKMTLEAGITYYIKELITPENGAYILNTDLTEVTVSDGKTTTAAVTEKPAYGYAYLVKTSSADLPSCVTGSSAYLLDGAVYKIYTDKSCQNAALTSDGGEAEFVTAEDGTSQVLEMPAGTYYVKEIQASPGYAMDDTVYELAVESGETTVLSVEESAYPAAMDITIAKYDKDSGEIIPASGIEFSLKYYLPDGTLYASYIYESDENGIIDFSSSGYVKSYTGTKTTDEDGNIAFYAGQVIIAEEIPPAGFESTDAELVYEIEASNDGSGQAVLSIESGASEFDASGYLIWENITIKAGKVKFGKIDSGTGTADAQGRASLEGAVIAIYNISSESNTAFGSRVYVNGEWYEAYTQEEILNASAAELTADYTPVLTVTTGADGIAETEEDVLPYGTYIAVEIKAPEGYLLNESWYQCFSVTESGEEFDFSQGEDENLLEDDVIRGDFRFIKKNDEYREMSNVLFQITSNTTGETHYLVTDENGEFNSSWNYTSHTTENVNGNDAAVTVNDDGTLTVDESLLNSAYGIWFGVESEPSYELSALPYDTYTITEIQTSVNTGYTMRTFTLTISQKDDGSGADTINTENEQQIVDYGTIVNGQITIQTSAAAADGTQYAESAESVYIRDKVTLTGLSSASIYNIEAVLMDAETGEIFADADGNTYSQTITVSGVSGTVSKYIEFESVNLTGMDGKSIVIFVYVYDYYTGAQVIEEADLENYDEMIFITEEEEEETEPETEPESETETETETEPESETETETETEPESETETETETEPESETETETETEPESETETETETEPESETETENETEPESEEETEPESETETENETEPESEEETETEPEGEVETEEIETEEIETGDSGNLTFWIALAVLVIISIISVTAAKDLGRK